jgi:hypothetical protein
VKTDELIVHLARGAEPVRVLPRPSVRLAQWMAIALTVAGLAVLIIGPRADLTIMLRQPAYVILALATVSIASLSGAAAFVLSVPGAERSRLQRVVPFALAAAWAFALVLMMRAGGHILQRVVAFPIHVACILEIAAIGVISGWVIFRMLQRAAPLDATWSAALAALAGTGVGAFATHVICPIDDPAHHLVGHFAPVMLLTMAGMAAGRRSLDWLRRCAAIDVAAQ